MQPHISHPRSQQCGWRHRSHILRLIDITEPHPVVDKYANGLFRHPTVMPHLGHQRELAESAAEANEEVPVLAVNLNDHGNWINSAPNFPALSKGHIPSLNVRISPSSSIAFMGESLVELGCKLEPRISLNFLDP